MGHCRNFRILFKLFMFTIMVGRWVKVEAKIQRKSLLTLFSSNHFERKESLICNVHN